jgi:hypothetical protein
LRLRYHRARSAFFLTVAKGPGAINLSPSGETWRLRKNTRIFELNNLTLGKKLTPSERER